MSITLISKYPLVLRFTDIETGIATPDTAYNKKKHTKIPRSRVFMNLGKDKLEELISIWESSISGYNRIMDNRIHVSDGVYAYTFVMRNGDAAAFNANPGIKTFEATAHPTPFTDKALGVEGVAITLSYNTPTVVQTPTVVKEKSLFSNKKVKFALMTRSDKNIKIATRRNPTRAARYTDSYRV